MRLRLPLFSPLEYCLMMEWGMGKFCRLAKNVPHTWVARRHGAVWGYHPDAFPKALRNSFASTLEQFECESLQELMAKRLSTVPQPAFSLEWQPPYTRWKAGLMRLVLSEYFCRLESGFTAKASNQIAGVAHHQFFGSTGSERHLRRLAAKVIFFGGPDAAPIEAYSDRKSTRHRPR